MTVPNGAMFPMSGINIAFNREIIGPTMFSGFASSRCEKKGFRLEEIIL